MTLVRDKGSATYIFSSLIYFDLVFYTTNLYMSPHNACARMCPWPAASISMATAWSNSGCCFTDRAGHGLRGSSPERLASTSVLILMYMPNPESKSCSGPSAGLGISMSVLMVDCELLLFRLQCVLACVFVSEIITLFM